MAEEPKTADAAKSAAQSPSSKVNAKVELDLDDAPFLEEEEEEAAPEPAKEPEPKKAAPAPAAPEKLSLKDRLLSNKKKLILAGGGAVVLLVAAVTVNVFLFSGEEAPPPPVAAPAPDPEVVLAAPKPLPEAPVPQFTMQWEPFWVELKDTEGAVRFLTCKFSVPTDNPILFTEMNAKGLILRDAIFYYLRNQPIISLRDEEKVQDLKSDLLTVMNEHLGSGKVSEILIEDYLVQ